MTSAYGEQLLIVTYFLFPFSFSCKIGKRDSCEILSKFILVLNQ